MQRANRPRLRAMDGDWRVIDGCHRASDADSGYTAAVRGQWSRWRIAGSPTAVCG